MPKKILTDLLKLLVAGARGYDIWIPHKIQVVSVGEGSCVCEFKVDEDLVNSNNNLHLGCISTTVDVITTLALMASVNPNPGLTTDLNVSCHDTARLGDEIVIDARTLQRSKIVAFLTADLYRKSNGRIIARGNHAKFLGHQTAMDDMSNRLL